MSTYLIYGANGYTGSLIAQMAVERGHLPILAGRSESVDSLAARLGLRSRRFDLDSPTSIDAGLKDVDAVLHCAGPFERTARPMAEACCRNRVHYLDITGEIGVFEMLAAMDRPARDREVLILPGVGFDVVPTDCLAVHLKRRLPTATHLCLGFQSLGRVSRGTATTMVENLHRGGAIRRDGQIRRVPAAWKTRTIDFGRGPVVAMTIPWGDVSTAWYSTGIPNIETYVAAPRAVRMMAWITRPIAPLLGSGVVQRWLKRRIQAQPPGPTDEQRARGRTLVWGEVCDDRGNSVRSRLRGPEGYTVTAIAALAIVERVLRGDLQHGFQTPARLYGPDFVLSLPGFERTDD